MMGMVLRLLGLEKVRFLGRVCLALVIFVFPLQRIQKYCLEPQYLMLSTLNGQAGLIGAALLGD